MVETHPDQSKQQSPSPLRSSRYERMMDILPVGFFLVSERGQLLLVNPCVVQMLDAGEERLSGSSYHTLFRTVIHKACKPDVVAQSLDTALLSIHQNPVVEVSLRESPERQIEICFFSVPRTAPDEPAWGGVVLDRTQEIRRLTDKARLAEDQIQGARRRLASIQGQLRALSTHQFQWGEEMMRDLFYEMGSAMDDVSGQVDHALDLLRLQNEGIIVYPRETDLAGLIQEVLDAVAVHMPACRVDFHSDGDLPAVRIDPERIKEVLEDCIRYLYTESERSAQLQLGADVEGNRVQLNLAGEVSRFENLPEPNPPPAGGKSGDQGQELIISRELIEAHGGRLWISGGEAAPSFTIHFTLPVMPQQRQTRIEQEGTGSGRGRDSETVLVADADSDQLTFLTSGLKQEGYRVLAAADGPAIIDITQSATPDLIILEWDLPGMSGLSATKYIRRWSSIPIMMLTSRSNPDNLLDAFEAGVDDFMTKPFLMDELLARVSALQRRYQQGEADFEEKVFEARGLRLDFDTQRVWRHGEPIDLTPTEYTLLSYMANHRRQVLPHRQLIEHAWEATEKGSRRGLFVHISRLRDKLEDDPDHPELIVTRWGVGYIFMP